MLLATVQMTEDEMVAACARLGLGRPTTLPNPVDDPSGPPRGRAPDGLGG